MQFNVMQCFLQTNNVARRFRFVFRSFVINTVIIVIIIITAATTRSALPCIHELWHAFYSCASFTVYHMWKTSRWSYTSAIETWTLSGMSGKCDIYTKLPNSYIFQPI